MKLKWDEDQKARAIRILGILIAALGVFTLLSTVSYLFTWKTDMSLLSNPEMMGTGVKVHNAAGKLGYRFADFLVGKCFGLGSLALLILLFALAARLLLHKWDQPLLKTTLLVLSGAFVSSLVFSCIAGLVGTDGAFGTGLGGQLGSFLVGWSNNLIGKALTAVLVLFLLCGWLFFWQLQKIADPECREPGIQKSPVLLIKCKGSFISDQTAYSNIHSPLNYSTY